MGGSGPTSGFALLVPPEPPVPVSAILNTVAEELSVTFDKPLQAGAVNGTQFTARGAGIFWDGLAGNAAGNTVVVGIETSGAEAGTPVCSFSATAGDLIGSNGQPVAAFTDFTATLVV